MGSSGCAGGRPRDPEEPRGHPYRCRRALPNRIVASQALATLRKMRRGSLDSRRGPDEPSADHGSRPSAITLKSSSFGCLSPDVENTRLNLEPPRRSEERSSGHRLGVELSPASRRHPALPPRSKERDGIDGIGPGTAPSSSSCPQPRRAFRKTPSSTSGRA